MTTAAPIAERDVTTRSVEVRVRRFVPAWMPSGCVLAVFAAGVATAWLRHPIVGTGICAGALLLAAALRFALSARSVLLLESRSRAFDVVFLLALAGLMLGIAVSLHLSYSP